MAFATFLYVVTEFCCRSKMECWVWAGWHVARRLILASFCIYLKSVISLSLRVVIAVTSTLKLGVWNKLQTSNLANNRDGWLDARDFANKSTGWEWEVRVHMLSRNYTKLKFFHEQGGNQSRSISCVHEIQDWMQYRGLTCCHKLGKQGSSDCNQTF